MRSRCHGKEKGVSEGRNVSEGDSQIRVLFFCLGNICRSPLAEAVFRHKVGALGLSDQIEIDSAGTSNYHVGESPHPGSQLVAKQRLGLDIGGQRGRQLTQEDVERFDYLVAMDESNKRDAERLGASDVLLLRDFEEDASPGFRDVPDPWGYGGEQFEYVYDLIERCCERFLGYVCEQHGLTPLPSPTPGRGR